MLCAIRDSNPGRKHAPCACADMGGFHHTPRPMAPRPARLAQRETVLYIYYQLRQTVQNLMYFKQKLPKSLV